jgi:hypothetical protein
MLERHLQKECCSCSKIVLVNRSNKARSSLLIEPKTVNMNVAQLGLMTGRYFMVMSSAKTLSKRMFELAANETRRSLEQSSSERRMMPSRQEQSHGETYRLWGHGNQHHT